MIIYFSGTGNSMSVAKDIANKMKTSYMHINDALEKQNEITDNVIGIVYPVYFVEMPLPVKEFFQKFNFRKEQYIFIVTTCSHTEGNACRTPASILKKRGCKLSYKSNLHMPQNIGIFLGLDKPDTSGLLEYQEKSVSKIVEDVKNKKCNVKKTSKSIVYSMGTAITYNRFTKNMLKKEVDRNICVGCGVCQRICPVGNIKVIDGKSYAGENCIECLACIQWCPNGSITAMKKHVDGKQYHHPKIILDDMFRRTYQDEKSSEKEEV